MFLMTKQKSSLSTATENLDLVELLYWHVSFSCFCDWAIKSKKNIKRLTEERKCLLSNQNIIFEYYFGYDKE